MALRFVAVDGDQPVGCGDVIEGLGPDGASSVAVSDLRFYVSNVQFYDAAGRRLTTRLDRNEFQYHGRAGDIAMIDLTGTDAGACAGDGLTYPEGTSRTNGAITGRVSGGTPARVTFDIGLPQKLMKQVIADNTGEGAPSPLAEMHWSWAFAYRFLVMNFTVVTDGAAGEGYVHIGSTDCGGDGTKALTDRDACGRINTPAVALDDFDPQRDTVAVDIRALLAGVDFTVTTEEATVPGVECHSFDQPDCPTVFDNLGLDFATGSADATGNAVFWAR
ncbi:MAG: metallo-mystery pair system four-Cys motif protein [Deltaproteobacteria bacterium]|nr:metallo-mystery pair system four-Cys motif protein [Deltaproteobacteria bacterium]